MEKDSFRVFFVSHRQLLLLLVRLPNLNGLDPEFADIRQDTAFELHLGNV